MRNDMKTDRRKFLTGAAAAGAAISLSTSELLSQTPKEKGARGMETVRVGVVGIGVKGSSHLGNLLRIPGVKVKAVCDVREIEIWRDGAWSNEPPEDDLGPQRIRFLAGVKPGEHRLRVTYVTEFLGEVQLPEHPGSADSLP